ncbi:MAG: UDP-glucose dehydrogenase family protein [Negativicutes bacterium]
MTLKIAVAGTGYVGLVTGACLAETGNTVWCVDKDQAKIDSLNQGKLPIFEPGLAEIVDKNTKAGRLYFTTSLERALEDATVAFITVGTPTGKDGKVDLSQVYAAAREIGQLIVNPIVIVNKSTVPVGTAQAVRLIVSDELALRGVEIQFDVVSNPEFLKEGGAVEDFMRPDRVVIGASNKAAADCVKQLYLPFIQDKDSILLMDEKSAEISKYAANAMLATRISFINEIARLCDKVGADINSVRQGMGTDRRIGMHFLNAGAGYGGSCFPKDVKELIATGQRYGIEMEIARAVENVNECQKCYLADMICRYFKGELTGKKIAVWGLAFKPQTDDMREAPSVVIIRMLTEMGVTISAYDPEAASQARQMLADCAEHIDFAGNMMAALDSADAIVLVTEWQQFKQPDFAEMKRRMRRPLIFDGRNQYDPEQMAQLGFEYFCVGRGYYV